MDRNRSESSVSICFASHAAGVTLLSAAIALISFLFALEGSRDGRVHFTAATLVTRSNSYTTPVDVALARASRSDKGTVRTTV
ncbi:hypothetical protein ABT158_50665 [Nonomuraea sp. NPDC001636]|uniref:hypothetical protein n=1 Tax=Nonomuraea sp. NPDC001636 TaxID=3154391 RepID=UPI00332BB5C6